MEVGGGSQNCVEVPFGGRRNQKKEIRNYEDLKFSNSV
jgi:hypothetical protein